MKNPFVSTILLFTVLSTSLIATEVKNSSLGKAGFRVVNTRDCFINSKLGKQEQQAFEALKNQKTALIDETSKKLNEIADKLSNPELLESMSPKEEQNLKSLYEQLSQDLNQLHNESYQVLYQADMRINQTLQNNIDESLKEIEKEGTYVILKSDACHYYSPELDVTDKVIKKLDEKFEKTKQAQNATNVEVK
jgi:outer membrane protein